MWHDVWAVIRREYLQRVRSKWFIAATVGGPLFMAALLVVPAFFAAQGERNERAIAIVDGTDRRPWSPDLGGWRHGAE